MPGKNTCGNTVVTKTCPTARERSRSLSLSSPPIGGSAVADELIGDDFLSLSGSRGEKPEKVISGFFPGVASHAGVLAIHGTTSKIEEASKPSGIEKFPPPTGTVIVPRNFSVLGKISHRSHSATQR